MYQRNELPCFFRVSVTCSVLVHIYRNHLVLQDASGHISFVGADAASTSVQCGRLEDGESVDEDGWEFWHDDRHALLLIVASSGCCKQQVRHQIAPTS